MVKAALKLFIQSICMCSGSKFFYAGLLYRPSRFIFQLRQSLATDKLLPTPVEAGHEIIDLLETTDSHSSASDVIHILSKLAVSSENI